MTTPRVLIIDPEEASAQYLAQEIGQAGYEVFTATSGKIGMITAWKERPHILIIEPTFTDMAPKEFMEKLRGDARTSHRIFIAFSALRDPSAIQDTMKLGFDQYIAKEADVIPSLLKAMQAALTKNRSKSVPRDVAIADSGVDLPTLTEKETVDEKNGKMIIMISAKGGAGTSSICANFAATMANLIIDRSVVLVDLDLPLGSFPSIVGTEGKPNIVSVSQMSGAATPISFYQKNLPKIPKWGFYLFSGPSTPEEASNLEVSRIPVIIDTLKRAFDYVVIDFGRSLSRISLPIILAADQVVLVTGVDEASVYLTGKVWKYLHDKGLDRQQMYPMINRAVGLAGLTRNEIEESVGIDIMNTIPFTDVNFTLANNQHMPYREKFPNDVATLSLLQAVNEVRGRLESSTTSAY